MFPPDLFKWGFIGGLYDVAAMAAIRMGSILSRKQFMEQAIMVLIGPEDLGELYAAGKRFQLVQAPMPPPVQRGLRGLPQRPQGNGKIII